MSRQVNWEEPSLEDFQWLVHWERWHDLKVHGYDVDDLLQRFGMAPSPDGQNFFNTEGVPGDDYEMRLNPETGLPETVRKDSIHVDVESDEDADSDVDLDGDANDGDSDELPEDYADWKVDDLKAELTDRGLATSGNKGDLVKRLEIDDKSQQKLVHVDPK